MTGSQEQDTSPDAGGQNAVDARIASYQPQLPASRWTAEVAAFVRATVAALPPRDEVHAANLLSLASRLAAWAHHDQGLDLTVEQVLSDATVEGWLAQLGTTPARVAYARSLLCSLRPGPRRDDAEPWRSRDPRDPDVIDAAITRYRPSGTDRVVWAGIRPEVVEVVRGCEPPSAHVAAQLMSVCTAYLAWCRTQPGMPADPAVVWNDRTVARYLAQQVAPAAAGPSTTATVRSALRRLGRSVRRSGMAPPARRLPRSDRPAPYTDGQVVRLTQAAAAQPTAARRDAMQALLALTLGAGLGERDVAWPCGDDVTRRDDGTTVVSWSARRGRTVVVADAWADGLLAVAGRAGSGPLLGPNGRRGARNLTNELVAKLALDPDLAPLTVTRLRDTWLVARLDAGCPLGAVLAQAGLASVSALDAVVAHLRTDDPAGVLRGDAGRQVTS